jgi:hypothetical protein
MYLHTIPFLSYDEKHTVPLKGAIFLPTIPMAQIMSHLLTLSCGSEWPLSLKSILHIPTKKLEALQGSDNKH